MSFLEAASPDQEALTEGLANVFFSPVEPYEFARDPDQPPPLRAYALIDASQSPDIAVLLEAFNSPSRCLFDGDVGEDLGEVAPWLVELTRFDDAWDWFIEDGYGKNWAILLHSRLEMARLKTQLKRFLKITDEKGESFFFKYYRPKHLNAYLPVFDDVQMTSFMKGIETIFAESDKDPNKLHQYRLKPQGGLASMTHDLRRVGEPLMPRVPSEEDAALYLKAMREGAK
ncbi:MAG: DUF4123 domain-containing protein [Paracoccaceae bacterium]